MIPSGTPALPSISGINPLQNSAFGVAKAALPGTAATPSSLDFLHVLGTTPAAEAAGAPAPDGKALQADSAIIADATMETPTSTLAERVTAKTAVITPQALAQAPGNTGKILPQREKTAATQAYDTAPDQAERPSSKAPVGTAEVLTTGPSAQPDPAHEGAQASLSSPPASPAALPMVAFAAPGLVAPQAVTRPSPERHGAKSSPDAISRRSPETGSPRQQTSDAAGSAALHGVAAPAATVAPAPSQGMPGNTSQTAAQMPPADIRLAPVELVPVEGAATHLTPRDPLSPAPQTPTAVLLGTPPAAPMLPETLVPATEMPAAQTPSPAPVLHPAAAPPAPGAATERVGAASQPSADARTGQTQNEPVVVPQATTPSGPLANAAAIPPSPTSPATEAPQDFATLVQRLNEAREAVTPQVVQTALVHAEFGRVNLALRHEDGGLSVTMASLDPSFAPAVQAALAAGADTARERMQGEAQQQSSSRHGTDPRSESNQQQRQDGGSSSGSNPSSASGSPSSSASASNTGQQQREAARGQTAGDSRPARNGGAGSTFPGSDTPSSAPRDGSQANGLYA